MASNSVKEITSLTGVNLRQEPADLDERDSSKLVNFDPFRTPGALVLRKGRTDLGEALLVNDPLIRTVAKVNGNRYQVAGRTPYRDMEAMMARNTLAVERETTIVPFRPLADSHIWAFFADDALMFKDDGENTYQWGIDQIPEPAPKLSNQTSKLNGDEIEEGVYLVAVTQIRMDITEA